MSTPDADTMMDPFDIVIDDDHSDDEEWRVVDTCKECVDDTQSSTCAICLEECRSDADDNRSTPCGHTFHKACMDRLFQHTAGARAVPCPPGNGTDLR